MSKKSGMKGFVVGAAVTASLAMSVSAYADTITKQIAVTYNDIVVTLDGQETALQDATGATVEPFIYNGTVYLPARAISEAVGLTASYDKTTKTVSLTSNGGTSTLPQQTAGTADAASLGSATYLLEGSTASKADDTISAVTTDTSAVKVTAGGVLTLNGVTLSKAGGTSSEDNSNFYGLNAALLAAGGSTITLNDSTLTTSANGANAVFATGAGSTVNVSGVTITTTEDSSHGLDATYTGTVNATNTNITTSGTHSASIATDRGNGTVNVTGGTMLTIGTDSPGIYSTGTISVSDALITSQGSEAAVIEGNNSITLKNTNLSGAKKSGIMLYQSFSGDAEAGTGTLTMTGGSLTAYAGPLFYATNTDAVINLKNTGLSSNSGILLAAGADQWGTKGSNGAAVTLNADAQPLTGDVTADSISSVALVLSNGSSLTGALDTANTAKSVSFTLDATSVWNVTADSYLSVLTDGDTTLSNIKDNGHTIYYDAAASTNSWLAGATITLSDGGRLTPFSS
ncbi:stalk domain-containing protein [Paenibacillus sp. FSL R7-0345]|uniref:stalk domain-containing protein n=1 Tax=Paenibacillus sp. FSL R7-0345 TaxID=2954535 RepID=UPI003159CB73